MTDSPTNLGVYNHQSPHYQRSASAAAPVGQLFMMVDAEQDQDRFPLRSISVSPISVPANVNLQSHAAAAAAAAQPILMEVEQPQGPNRLGLSIIIPETGTEIRFPDGDERKSPEKQKGKKRRVNIENLGEVFQTLSISRHLKPERKMLVPKKKFDRSLQQPVNQNQRDNFQSPVVEVKASKRQKTK